ncbi:MAG TPA: CsbD family protein [Mycobacteriales bacterium]|nr:CsbD family protein [Mycobacteriales bacterium]
MGAMDKISNKAEELKGDVKETVGDATDDQQMENEGKKDQVTGNLKQAGEKVKDAFS